MGMEQNFSFRERALNKIVEGNVKAENLSPIEITVEEKALNKLIENTPKIYKQKSIDLIDNEGALSQARKDLENAASKEVLLLQKIPHIKEIEKEVENLKMDAVNQYGDELSNTQEKIARLNNDRENFLKEIRQNQEILDTFDYKIYQLGEKVAKGMEEYEQQEEVESKFEQN